MKSLFYKLVPLEYSLISGTLAALGAPAPFTSPIAFLWGQGRTLFLLSFGC